MRTSSFRRPRRGRTFGTPSFNGRPVKPTRTIHYSRFVNESVAPADVIEYVPTNSFNDFPFDERVKRAVTAKGYQTPTAIQDQAIPHVLAGRDLIGLANTGTGKTAAFVLPIINRFLRDPEGTALIIAPTRELAQQIDDDFKGFAGGLNLWSALCVGGVPEYRQIQALKRRPRVIIGTPGRIKAFLTGGQLKVDRCRTFVLDEADRMLDMGFINDVRTIIGYLPKQRQSLCLSATITPEVQGIINTLLTDPVTVSVRTRETGEHIDQDVIHVASANEKVSALESLLATREADKVLIFGETKHGVQRLSEKLEKRGIATAAIHGNKNQSQRTRALAAFKQDRVQVLVATDVAARGLDIPAVSHVVNYDVPKTYEDYVHRIGRTGRAGKRGKAITFVPPKRD